MIGRIRGIILEKQPPYLLLEAGNIGYEIIAPMTTFYQLPDLHQEIMLYTHLIVREDAHQLYGFYQEQDRRLFRALIKINNIGPKLALTILSGIESSQFTQCIMNNDLLKLKNIPGVGPKTAERLIMEMKETLKDPAFITTDINQSFQDAISALISLGYKPHEAKQAITQVQQPQSSSEELIRLALKQKIARKPS